MKLKRTSFILALFLALWIGGCTSSNLHERPSWAKNNELPQDEAKKYSSDQYLVQVVTGVAKTLKGAEEAAKEEARKTFARMVLTKVTNVYQKQTDVLETKYQKSLKKKINSYVRLVTKDILLTGLKKVATWDGYEEDQKYYFACYVLDKDLAGNVIQQKALENFKALEQNRENLVNARSQKQKEYMAIEALKNIMDFELLKQQALFFDRNIPIFKNGQALKQKCLKIIYQAIDERMASSESQELEEALEFAQKALEYYPTSTVRGKLIEIKRRLPCTECGRSGKCPNCSGKKGFLQTCPTCLGNQQVYTECPVCKGDGKRTCPQCNGAKTVTEACRNCNESGRVTCPTCKGKGSFVGKCNRCDGNKIVTCQKCQGEGVVYDQQNQARTCPSCQGQKQFTCPKCQGNGRLRYKCEASAASQLLGLFTGSRKHRYKFCGGSGRAICPQCNGTTKIHPTCPKCQGQGRYGTCPRCQGQTRIIIPCPKCPPEHKGKIFEKCKNCDGTGVCPTCKGKGRRV